MYNKLSIMDAARLFYFDQCPESIEKLVEVIEEFFQPPPENVCYMCGKTDSENEADGYGPCIDVTVTTCESEEGYSRVSKYVCYEDIEFIVAKLADIGFISHHHGSTSTLEDKNCPGYEVYGTCPTPKGYGEEEDPYA